MKTDLSNLSTFQLARALQWQIKNLHKRMSAIGYVYHVDLNGETMPASEARRRCEAAIHEKQSTQPTQ